MDFSMGWQKIYDAFPVNREYIWLNNCGFTPAGFHIQRAVSRFLGGYARKGLFTKTAGYPDLAKSIKSVLSNLLGCLPEELALTHNTAEGMNFVSHGIDLRPGDEIVLLENEYPSNVYPWRHWQDKGVRLLFAPMAATPAAFLESFDEILTPRTRLVTLSAVHWCTGMPLPLDDIGGLCQSRGIDFVVDGAQGVGMQPIDVKRAGIDFMAFSAWKWLMGPLGLGVFYISKEKLEDLKPVFTGTGSVVRELEYLPYKTELKPTADRFTFSTPGIIDWVYLQAALEFLDDIGSETVRNRIFELSRHLNRRLSDIGFDVLANTFPENPTGIIVCEKPGIPTGEILSLLDQNGIVAAERLDRIRFSPHIFNSPEQIDQVIKVLEST
jgi:selenocysteine lyase/cysteine desulfurase